MDNLHGRSGQPAVRVRCALSWFVRFPGKSVGGGFASPLASFHSAGLLLGSPSEVGCHQTPEQTTFTPSRHPPLLRTRSTRLMSVFWKPGTAGPGGLERGDDGSAQLVNPRLSNLPLNTQRQSLPIYRHRNSLLFALQKYRATVLVGETGCGKTTQVSSACGNRVCKQRILLLL